MDELLLVGIVWGVLAGAVAITAVAMQRSGIKWFAAALLISPLFAFLALMFSGVDRRTAERLTWWVIGVGTLALMAVLILLAG